MYLICVTAAEQGSMVQCQLCFDKIDPAQTEHHLKEVHRIAAAAIDNIKPLTHWFRPADAQA
jgi:hypothetical protein